MTVESRRRDWGKTLATYTHPRVVTLLFLGFSAGLPFLLVFSTLSAWLREFGISRTAIGFISWIGITYSFKFVWSPVVDRVPLVTEHAVAAPTLGQRLADYLGRSSTRAVLVVLALCSLCLAFAWRRVGRRRDGPPEGHELAS